MTSRSETFHGSLAGQRVLVVGGRGFVGSHIVRALVAAGARLHLFGPPMAEDRLADLAGAFDESEGSITSGAALREVLRESQAQSIVSCAAHGMGRLGLMRSSEAENEAAMAVNVTGLHQLLEAARDANVRRVVWTSSTVVYGPSECYPSQPIDEEATIGPTTFYGLTKVLAEEVARYHARRFGTSVVGLRLPLILGPGLWYEGAAAALMGLFEAARSGTPYHLRFHDEAIDLMHASDVASATITVLQHDGALALAYNLQAFAARASELVHEIASLRPRVSIEITPAPPALLFPLVSGKRFRADTGFVARFDRRAFVEAMLS